MTTKQIRLKLDRLHASYEYAKRLGKQRRMAALNREMVGLMLTLLKRSNRRAA